MLAGVTGLHLPLGQMALSVVDLSGEGAGFMYSVISSCIKADGWPQGRLTPMMFISLLEQR